MKKTDGIMHGQWSSIKTRNVKSGILEPYIHETHKHNPSIPVNLTKIKMSNSMKAKLCSNNGANETVATPSLYELSLTNTREDDLQVCTKPTLNKKKPLAKGPKRTKGI